LHTIALLAAHTSAYTWTRLEAGRTCRD